MKVGGASDPASSARNIAVGATEVWLIRLAERKVIVMGLTKSGKSNEGLSGGSVASMFISRVVRFGQYLANA